MTLADQAAMTGHDGQVASGKPVRPARRTFTAAYKARILAAYDALEAIRPLLPRFPVAAEFFRREAIEHQIVTGGSSRKTGRWVPRRVIG